jgi:hypothetical protein
LPALASQSPASGPDWLHEIKHDGFRILARRDAKGVRLITRNGHDFADRFPSVVAAVGTLWRGVNTARWLGEAGIPPTVSEVLGDCSLRLAVAPMTKIWQGLIGKPDSS